MNKKIEIENFMKIMEDILKDNNINESTREQIKKDMNSVFNNTDVKKSIVLDNNLNK